MPQALHDRPSTQLPPETPRRRWTREECAALEAAGLLDRERYELIAGDLVRRTRQGPVHNVVLGLFIDWLKSVYSARRVLQEATIDPAPGMVAANEPEPDAVVFRIPYTQFLTANARSEDILLVGEVSVTTLAYDLGVKAALYAAAGIPEYWVLDTTGQRLLVHRRPEEGAYRSVVAFGAEEPVSPPSAPEASIRLRELLG